MSEQYHLIPSEAFEHLASISHEPTRQHVTDGIQRLHLIEDLGKQELPAQSTESQSPHNFVGESERVKYHMTSITKDASVAHAELSLESGSDSNTVEVWNRILKRQLGAAVEAKQRGDIETATRSLADYLVAIQLAQPEGGEHDFEGEHEMQQGIDSKVLDEAVVRGLAPELVQAARQSYGLVRIKEIDRQDDGFGLFDTKTLSEIEVVSIAHTIEKIKPEIEIVTGRAISLDPAELEQGVVLSSDETGRRIAGLSLVKAASTAAGVSLSDQYNAEQKPKLLDDLTRQALHELPEQGESATEKSEAMARLSQVNPDILMPDKYEQEFRSIRSMRRVDSDYRGNFDAALSLDKTLIGLWEGGHHSLAGRMLTAGNEIIEENGYMSGALGSLESDSPSTILEIKQEVERRQTLCRQELTAAFRPTNEAAHTRTGNQDLTESIISQVMTTADPERATQIVLGWSQSHNADEVASVIHTSSVDKDGDSRILTILTNKEDPITDLEELSRVLSATAELPLRFGFSKINIEASALLDNSDDGKNLRQFLYSSLTEQQPLWKTLVQFNELIASEKIEDTGALQNHAVTEIPFDIGLGVPLENVGSYTSNAFGPYSFADLTIQQKRLMAADQLRNLSDDEVTGLQSLQFNRFTDQMKRNLLAYQTQQTIEQSQNAERKQQADLRNRAIANEGVPLLEVGDFIHTTTFDPISVILQNGNMATELLGENTGIDAYPYNVDLKVITGNEKTFAEKVMPAINTSSSKGANGQIALLYKRTPASWMSGREIYVSPVHALIFAGVPSTEITGIALDDPVTTFDAISRAVVENDFYIPLCDKRGNIIFTPKQYQDMRGNLSS